MMKYLLISIIASAYIYASCAVDFKEGYPERVKERTCHNVSTTVLIRVLQEKVAKEGAAVAVESITGMRDTHILSLSDSIRDCYNQCMGIGKDNE